MNIACYICIYMYASFKFIDCALQELMEGMDSDRPDGGGSGALEKLSTKLLSFISEARGVKSNQLLLAIVQLCYHDTQLCYDVWVELFPKLWTTLTDRQRTVSIIHACCPNYDINCLVVVGLHQPSHNTFP